MKIKNRSKVLVVFSAISLTDIVLLLLIFFLLSSSFVVQSGIKVKLPGAKSQEPNLSQLLTISLTKNGLIWLGAETQTTFDELPPLLAARINSMENKRILLQADREVPLDWVVRLMDIIKIAGGTDITIATQRDLNNGN